MVPNGLGSRPGVTPAVPAVTFPERSGRSVLAMEDLQDGLAVASAAAARPRLAAAALFSPLRRRVQHVVDRRFNRARYDADQTIAAFATHLKDSVDLDSVRTDLTAVVHSVLEPAHVSLWLTPRD